MSAVPPAVRVSRPADNRRGPSVVSAGAVPARRQLLTHHLPAVLWLAAMTVALAVPADRADLPGWWPRLLHFHALDKVIHGLLFLVAALLLARSLRCLSALRWPLLTALLLLVAYGAATELAQHLFTDRRGEAMDVAADVGGATAGVLLLAARRSVGGGPGAAR